MEIELSRFWQFSAMQTTTGNAVSGKESGPARRQSIVQHRGFLDERKRAPGRNLTHYLKGGGRIKAQEENRFDRVQKLHRSGFSRIRRFRRKTVSQRQLNKDTKSFLGRTQRSLTLVHHVPDTLSQVGMWGSDPDRVPCACRPDLKLHCWTSSLQD